MLNSHTDMISKQHFIAEKRDQASIAYCRSLVKLGEGAVLPTNQTYALEQTQTQSLESIVDIERQTQLMQHKTVSAPKSNNQSTSIMIDTSSEQRYFQNDRKEKSRSQPCLSILIQVAALNRTIKCQVPTTLFTGELQTQVLQSLGMPDTSNAYLTLQGRPLSVQMNPPTLHAAGLRQNSIIQLACPSLLGGGSAPSAPRQVDADDDFRRQEENTSASIDHEADILHSKDDNEEKVYEDMEGKIEIVIDFDEHMRQPKIDNTTLYEKTDQFDFNIHQRQFEKWAIKKVLEPQLKTREEISDAQLNADPIEPLEFPNSYELKSSSLMQRPGEPNSFIRVEELEKVLETQMMCKVKKQNDEFAVEKYQQASNFFLSTYDLCPVTLALKFRSDQQIDEPKPPKDSTQMLFTGRDLSLFWVSQDKSDKLTIHTLEKGQVDPKEASISEASCLHTYWNKGNSSYTERGSFSTPSAEPTLVEVNKQKMVVFSYFQYTEKPCVLFYDIENKRETIRVDGACFFLHMRKLKESEVAFTFFSDQRFCDEVIENQFALRSMVKKVQEDVPDEKLCLMKEVVIDTSKIESENLTAAIVENSISKIVVEGQQIRGKDALNWFRRSPNTVSAFKVSATVDAVAVYNNSDEADKMCLYSFDSANKSKSVPCAYKSTKEDTLISIKATQSGAPQIVEIDKREQKITLYNPSLGSGGDNHRVLQQIAQAEMPKEFTETPSLIYDYLEYCLGNLAKQHEDGVRKPINIEKTLQNMSKPSWFTSNKYPLFAVVDKNRSNRLFLAYQANNLAHRISMNLSEVGQFFCFATEAEESGEASISMIVEQANKLMLVKVTLKNSFQHEALLQNGMLELTVTDFSCPVDHLRDLRDSIRSCYILCGGYHMLISTQDKIILSNYKKQTQIIFENKGEVRLSSIDLISTNLHSFYYATQDNSNQLSVIREFKVEWDGTVKEQRNAFSCSSDCIVAMQLCRDKESDRAPNYNNAGHLVWSEEPLDLLVLDKSYNYYRLRKNKTEHITVSNRRIKSTDFLDRIYSEISPFESLSMTERTLTFRSETFSIVSGVQYVVCPEKGAIDCMPVHQTDKIVMKLHSEEKLSFMSYHEPGTRSCNVLGTLGLINLQNAVNLTEDLFLYQFKEHWTLVKNNEIVEIEDKLKVILEDQNWTDVKARTISGNICKVALYYRELKTEKGKYIPIEQCDGKAMILDLDSEGQLMSSEEIVMPDHEEQDNGTILQEEILLNHEGKHVFVRRYADNSDSDSDNSRLQDNSGDDKQLRVTRVAGYEACLNAYHNEYLDMAYAGRFVCFRPIKDSKIYVFTMRREKGWRPSIFWNDEDQINEIRLNDYTENVEEDMFMDACQPSQLIKISSVCNLDFNTMQYLNNFLQVTQAGTVLVFDLNSFNPRLINVSGKIKQLCDPQKYVESGQMLNLLSDRIESRLNSDFHYLKQTYLQVNTQGSMVMKRQKANIPRRLTHRSYEIKWMPVLGVFKTFSWIDLQESFTITEGENIDLDINIMWALFGQETILSLSGQDLRQFDALRGSIEALAIGEMEDDSDARRLALCTSVKTHFDSEMKSMTSLIQENLGQKGLRDILLKIGRQSEHFTIFDAYTNQSDFETMTSNSTAQTTCELEECFMETWSTKKIESLDWPKERSMLTLRKSDCVIDKESIVRELENDDNRVTRAVKVKMLSLGWFFSERKNFISFSKLLPGLPNRVFQSQFIESLLDRFWDDAQMHIFKTMFLPFFCLVILTILFFMSALSNNVDEIEELWKRVIHGLLTAPFIFYQIKLELKQMEAAKSEYFKSIWNWVDMISLALTTFIFMTMMTPKPMVDLGTLRVLAALASCTLLYKVFDWLRLFEDTAFYILLMEETLKDIQAFMILLLVALASFGVPMIILDFNRTEDDDNVSGYFGFWVFNMLINQYLLALGEFNMDNFADKPQAAMCFIFFILATFLTQLTMLNMLIAIMGDTFERVIENRDVNAIKSKLDLLSDLVATMAQRDYEQDEKQFLFLVMPDDADDDDGDEWEGTIKKMTRHTEKNIQDMGRQLEKKQDKLQLTIEEFKKVDGAQDKILKDYLGRVIVNSQKKTDEKLSDMVEMFTTVQNQGIKIEHKFNQHRQAIDSKLQEQGRTFEEKFAQQSEIVEEISQKMDDKFKEQDQAIVDVSKKIEDSFVNLESTLSKLIKEQRSSPMQVKQTQQSVQSVEEDDEQDGEGENGEGENDGAEEQEEEEEESKSQE